jgi:hypothetical protein
MALHCLAFQVVHVVQPALARMVNLGGHASVWVTQTGGANSRVCKSSTAGTLPLPHMLDSSDMEADIQAEFIRPRTTIAGGAESNTSMPLFATSIIVLMAAASSIGGYFIGLTMSCSYRMSPSMPEYAEAELEYNSSVLAASPGSWPEGQPQFKAPVSL